jgi:biotin carboxyl carrier protein
MIPIPRCRLVLAPVEGRLLSSLPDRTLVAAGDVVGTVESSRGSHTLLAPWAGRVGGALVGALQTVAIGDGVVWLDVA